MSEEDCNETTSVPGSVCWNEIASSNLADSQKFYSGLFGWSFETPPGMEGYSMASAGDMPVVGAMDKSEQCDGPALWVSYIHVEDVAASLAKAVELGAKEMRGVTEVPGKGSFALINDPQGAVVGMWQPA